MTNVRADWCRDCQQMTGGGCGKHNPNPVEVVWQPNDKIMDLREAYNNRTEVLVAVQADYIEYLKEKILDLERQLQHQGRSE